MLKCALAKSVISVFLVAGCATLTVPFKPEVGNPEFREWCRSALSGEKHGIDQALFKEAFNGDRTATERLFQMALDYEMASKMRPEDEMWLTLTIETILYRQGDAKFAALLGAQSGQVQAAVGTFLLQRIDASSPKTATILRSAPKIDFPLEKAYRKIK